MKITNPLDNFQSHSFHYVILAASSTENIKAFTNNDADALTAINNTKALGDSVLMNDASALLLIDTRRFSQFQVDGFNLKTFLVGFGIPGSKTPHSVGQEMTLNIIDSNGISFANFLQYIMNDKLQVSYQGMTLLVKMVFVGHKEDGTSEVVETVTIPAYINKIQMDLNQNRGYYACTLYPLDLMCSTNTFNYSWTHIGSASSFFTGQNKNTLNDVITSFEQQLNLKSKAFYDNVNLTVFGNLDAPKGRLVQYMITLPSNWKEFTFGGSSRGKSEETDFKALIKATEDAALAAKAEADKQAAQTAAQQNNSKTAAVYNAIDSKNKDSFVSVETGISITDVLLTIFKQVPQILELGNFKSPLSTSDNLKFFKILLSVTSDDKTFTIHVDVVEFTLPNLDPKQPEVPGFTKPDVVNGTNVLVPRNFIEYDYFYSGKNIDILNLEVKIENLNYLLMTGTKLGEASLNKKVTEGQNQASEATNTSQPQQLQGIKPLDPIFMPIVTKDDKRNFAGLSANASTTVLTPQQRSQQFTKNVAAFYNVGPITTKMTIRGNPNVMMGFVLPGGISHTVADTSGNSLSKDDHRRQLEEKLAIVTAEYKDGASFVQSPIFMKVNIYGQNVDFLTNEPIPNAPWATLLFDNNYYYVNQVESRIEGAKFIQEFTLNSYNVYQYPTGK